MTQQNFINKRENYWKELEEMVKGGGRIIRNNPSLFASLCRELSQDLNTAKANGYDPSVIDRLNILVHESNELFFTKHPLSLKQLKNFFISEFPGTVRTHWRSLVLSFLVFYGLILFFMMLCIRNPNFVYEIMGRDSVRHLEEMYNPESGYYLTPRDAGTDANMFGFYIHNNISIAFRTFAGGIFAGLGSIIILAFNGAFLGTALGHIMNTGYGGTFFPFVIGHSSFELTAIVFAAQGGLILGFRLFFTRGLSRVASLKTAGETALPLILGAAIMLFIAAGIEAFWSSRHEFPFMLRYAAGAMGWILVIFYFVFTGKEKK